MTFVMSLDFKYSYDSVEVLSLESASAEIFLVLHSN